MPSPGRPKSAHLTAFDHQGGRRAGARGRGEPRGSPARHVLRSRGEWPHAAAAHVESGSVGAASVDLLAARLEDTRVDTDDVSMRNMAADLAAAEEIAPMLAALDAADKLADEFPSIQASLAIKAKARAKMSAQASLGHHRTRWLRV